MLGVHSRLHVYKSLANDSAARRNPLRAVAADLAAEARLLVFDEFQVPACLPPALPAACRLPPVPLPPVSLHLAPHTHGALTVSPVGWCSCWYQSTTAPQYCSTAVDRVCRHV